MNFNIIFLIVINLIIIQTASADVEVLNEKTESVERERIGNDYFRVDSTESHSAIASSDPIEDKDDIENLFLNGMSSNEDTKVFKEELKLGNNAELYGTNQHYIQSNAYPNLDRRFVPQYPYKEVINNVKNNNPQEDSALIPVQESPDVVLAIAKQSQLIENANPPKLADTTLTKNILRDGNYWNAVWSEDVDPKNILRSNGNQLESIAANIKPGTKIYKLVSTLKKISPKLIYVINKKNYN